jgi:hypothetical protein
LSVTSRKTIKPRSVKRFKISRVKVENCAVVNVQWKKYPAGIVYTRCPRTRAPEKKGEIFIKGQINNPNEKFFYVERYSRKEQFNSTNQSILSHPGLFPVIVARLHILLRFQ